MKKISFVVFAVGLFTVAGLFFGCKNKNPKSADSGISKRVIQVATIIGQAPYSFIDDNNNAVGYAEDVITEVFKLLPQYEVKFVPYTGLEGLLGTQAGKFQIVADKKFWTAERAKNYLIPKEPFGAVENGVAYRAADKDKFGNLELIGKNKGRLAPIPATFGNYPILVEWNEKHPDIAIKLEPTDNTDSAIPISWVLEGRYDAHHTNHDNFIKLVEESDGPYHKYKEQLGWTTTNATATYPLFNLNEQQLLEDYEKAFKIVSENGTLLKLSQKWFNANLFDYLKE